MAKQDPGARQAHEEAKMDIVLAFRKVNLMACSLDTLQQIKALIDADPGKS